MTIKVKLSIDPSSSCGSRPDPGHLRNEEPVQDMTCEPSSPRPPAPDSETPDRQEKAIDSSELFKGSRELVIRHNQERYILRITRQGKLILNK
jgi:hemin uptake protein HemP